jgi:hypothetical protein
MTADQPGTFPALIPGAEQPTIEFVEGLVFHEPVRELDLEDGSDVLLCACGRAFSDAKLLEAHLAEVAG